MNKNLILKLITLLSQQRYMPITIFMVLMGGFGIVLYDYSFVMAQPYPPPDNQPAQQATQPYPPPGAQPGTQQTPPYPAPVTPTSIGPTPAYPPPGITPVETQTPDEISTFDPMRTPGLLPLPLEFLELEFPTRTTAMVTDGLEDSQGTDEVLYDTGLQPAVLFLISLLWIILGGWVYLIAKLW
jgi:hypothetical protein